MGAVFPALPSASYCPRREGVLSYYIPSPNYNATGVPLLTVLRAALVILMSSCTGSDEIVFGVMEPEPGRIRSLSGNQR